MADKTKAAMPGRQCNNTKHIQDARVNAGGQRMSQRNSTPAVFIQLFCKAFSHPGRNTSRSLLPQRIFVVKQDFKRKAATIKTAAKMIIFFIAHPFGSMPRDCSSLRIIRFIQVASDESPSLRISSSSCERSSCAKRIWYWSVLAFSLDIVITKLLSLNCCNYNVTKIVLQQQNTAKPGSVGALTGPLTTSDS